MDGKNPMQGNRRTPYKMVALITVWVDDDQDHEAMIHANSLMLLMDQNLVLVIEKLDLKPM